MRRILTGGSVVATLLALTSCGGSQPPTSPSAWLPAAPVAVSGSGNSASLIVAWSCLTQSVPRVTGIFSSIATEAGCPASHRQLTRLNSAAATAPGAPGNLLSSVSGTTVSLGWTGNRSGDAATSYVIEAGSSAGASDLLVFDTGTSGQGFTATSVPAGTYYVRVRARTSAGTSDPSNEVLVTVGGGLCQSGTPSAPSGLTSSVSGSSVSFSWIGPASGCANAYLIEAGSTPGSSNLANFSTESTATTFSAPGVPAGTYYVRVRAARSAQSVSPPSNEVTVIVGGSTPTSIAGRWVGVAPDGVLISDPSSCDSEQDITIDLTQTGSTFSGTMTDRPRAFHPTACTGPTSGRTNPLTGTVNGGAFSFTSPGEEGGAVTCTGTFTATRLTASCDVGGRVGVMTIAANRQ